MSSNVNDFPLISIVIPSYSRAKRINKAIDSALNQTYSNIEIIIIDDNGLGTSDQIALAEQIKPYLGSGLIRYLPLKSNSGGSIARNKGIEAAKGSYIAFLDDDDELLAESIERRLNVFLDSDDEQLAIVGSDMYVFNEETGQRTYPKSWATFYAPSLGKFLERGMCFTPMLMVRRDALLKTGGFVDTPRFQDHLLMYRLLEHGYRAEHVPEPLFIHNWHTDERVMNINTLAEGWRNRRKVEQRLMTNFSFITRQRVRFRWYLNLVHLQLNENDGFSLKALWLVLCCLFRSTNRRHLKDTGRAFRMLIYPSYRRDIH